MRRVPFTFVRMDEGLVAVVQAPLKEAPRYAETMAARVAEALVPVVRHVEREYLRPFELERAEGHELIPIVVLPTRGTMLDYQEDRQGAFVLSPDSGFGYDQELNAAIVYVERGMEAMRSEDIRRELGGPLVLAILRAVRGEKASPYRWFAQGFAAHVARKRCDEAGQMHGLPLSEPFKVKLRRMVEAGNAPILWHGVQDLLRIDGWNPLVRIARRRAEDADTPLPTSEDIYQFYGSACFALTVYLDDVQSHDGYRRFLAGALAGRIDAGAFVQSLALGSVAEIDAEWRAWLGLEIGVDVPLLAPAAADEALPEKEALDGVEAGPGAAGASVAPPEPARADPFPDLRVRALDPGLDADCAVALVEAGRVDEARALLEASGAEDPLRAWLEAWRELRDAFLADAVASGATVRLEIGGERRNVKLVSVGVDGVELEARGSGAKTLPLEALDGVPLALAIGTNDADRLVAGGSWKRGIPLACAGHERARRTLRGGGATAEAIEAALSERFPAALARGRIALVLDDMSKLTLETDALEAEVILERLRPIVPSLAGDAILSAKGAAVRDAARALYERIVAARGMEALVAGEVERLPAEGEAPERVRIRWTFDVESAARDLRPLRELAWRTASFRRLKGDESTWKNQPVGDHVLLVGQHALVLPVGLRPPLHLRLSYGSRWDESMAGLQLNLMAGFAGPDGMDYVLAGDHGQIEYAVRRRSSYAEAPSAPDTFVNTRYEFELDYDGKEAVQRFAGLELNRVAVEGGPGVGGGALQPCLVVSTDFELHLHALEVEGTLGADLPRAEVDAWVDARMAELFGE